MAGKAEVTSTVLDLREVTATSESHWTVTLDQLRDVVKKAEDLDGKCPVTVTLRTDSVTIKRRYEHYIAKLIVRND